MTGRREEHKAQRRERILDAALDLLSVRDSSDITTEEIAARANLSPATVYNLIGTRDDLVQAAATRVIGQLTRALSSVDPADPIAAARLIVDLSIDVLTERSAAYRRIVAMAKQSIVPRPDRVDPSEFMVVAMQRAQEMGILRVDVDAAGLARQIYVSYSGALSLWASGELDDAGVRTAARHGLVTALAAASSDAERPGYLAELLDLGRELESTAWTGRR